MHQTPEDVLDAYVRAFESKSVDEVAAFYVLPCTFIRPDGTWVVQDERHDFGRVGNANLCNANRGDGGAIETLFCSEDVFDVSAFSRSSGCRQRPRSEP